MGSGVTSNVKWYNDIWSAGGLGENIKIGLTKYQGENLKNYVKFLNDMLYNHHTIWLNNKNSVNNPPIDDGTRQYQTNFNTNNYLNYNNLGIKYAWENKKFSPQSSRPTSGDNSSLNWVADGRFSGITDARRLLGRKGDWNDLDLKKFNETIKSSGYYLHLRDNEDLDAYYYLDPIENNKPNLLDCLPPLSIPNLTPFQPLGDLKSKDNSGKIPTNDINNNSQPSFWNRLGTGLTSALPDILELGRLASDINTNKRIYNIEKNALRPDLLMAPRFYSQVVGDEAAKLQYYTMASLLQSKTQKPVTSDMNTQLAYALEGTAKANELRALGNILDNNRIWETTQASLKLQLLNTENATNVANQNVVALNRYRKDLGDLESGWVAADLTSLSNYIQGVESRIRQTSQRNKDLLDQAWLLGQQNNLLTDSDLVDALNAVYAAQKVATDSKTGIINWSDPNLIKAQKALTEILNRKQMEMLMDRAKRNTFNLFGITWAKRGTKIKESYRDDLLYKTAKDAVDHFRKIYKMTSDATIRSRTKPFKVRGVSKMLQGGVAPFRVFTPVTLSGGSSEVSSYSTGSSKKSSEDTSEKDLLQLMKDLFAKVEGLPVDTLDIFVNMQNFLGAIRTGASFGVLDIASRYLASLLLLNRAKYSQASYNEAQNRAAANDGLSEFAVTPEGLFVVLDMSNGNVKYAKLDDIKTNKNLNPLTNSDLLRMRALSPNLKYQDDIFAVVSNGKGLEKIIDFIRTNLPTMGTSENKLELYIDSRKQVAINGLKILEDAPPGSYKFSQLSKDLINQANYALMYILGILPRDMQQLLLLHAYKNNIDASSLLRNLIYSQTSTTNNFDITAAPKGTGKDGSSTDDASDLTLSAATALIMGNGYRNTIELNPGTSYSTNVVARYSLFQTHSGENMGNGMTMRDATKSTLNGVLDWNKATLGGSRILSNAYDHIILNNGQVAGVDLPVDSKGDPDFSMLKNLQQLDVELLKQNIKDTPLNWKEVNKVCEKLNIPPKYASDGSLNKYSWKRFAAFLGITDDSALVDKKAILNDLVTKANSDVRDLYEQQMLSKNKEYDLSDPFLWMGGLEVYQGTIFVPINEDYVAAVLSGGLKMKMEAVTDLKLKQEGYDKDKAKSYQKSSITPADLKKK